MHVSGLCPKLPDNLLASTVHDNCTNVEPLNVVSSDVMAWPGGNRGERRSSCDGIPSLYAAVSF